MKNKFNNLTSKEWLPFQKSWFKFEDWLKLYEDNICFFTKKENDNEVVYYSGPENSLFEQVVKKNGLSSLNDLERANCIIQYALIDLMDKITPETTLKEYEKIQGDVLNEVKIIYNLLSDRRFITVLIPNIEREGSFYPFAWDLAKEITSICSLKDEKIGCFESPLVDNDNKEYFNTNKSTFYCLYFRKDDNGGKDFKQLHSSYFTNTKQLPAKITFQQTFPQWFILKPKPRKKDEILHPAKYPEDLVDMCVQHFTKENDNVFDPMAGTGSTQLGALRNKRNGYGTELSDFFAGIANGRCKEYLEPSQLALFGDKKEQDFKILCKDARTVSKDDFPEMDYILTSPPYWDMLNMKGAENQAKRLEKGLQTNYSKSDRDLGNINDYDEFLNELSEIYISLLDILKPGGYMTIVVKNIKKQGKNYPFAWDLANKLQNYVILLPEFFWCQDDISIAPYGYGNTWVSNTFHQYCLNFQKPL